MVTQNTNSITFTHFIEFKQNDTIYCAARQRESDRIQLYLILNHTGQVYSRTRNSWEPLTSADGDAVRNQVAAQRALNIPYYVSHSSFVN